MRCRGLPATHLVQWADAARKSGGKPAHGRRSGPNGGAVAQSSPDAAPCQRSARSPGTSDSELADRARASLRAGPGGACRESLQDVTSKLQKHGTPCRRAGDAGRDPRRLRAHRGSRPAHAAPRDLLPDRRRPAPFAEARSPPALGLVQGARRVPQSPDPAGARPRAAPPLRAAITARRSPMRR